jgi:hypothetical protein
MPYKHDSDPAFPFQILRLGDQGADLTSYVAQLVRSFEVVDLQVSLSQYLERG